ncbi:hypothetical protein GCM10009779_10640 [Polymorphospora rubra]
MAAGSTSGDSSGAGWPAARGCAQPHRVPYAPAVPCLRARLALPPPPSCVIKEKLRDKWGDTATPFP